MIKKSVSHDLWSTKQHLNIAKTEGNVKGIPGCQSDRARNFSTRSSQRIKENITPIKPNVVIQSHKSQDEIKQVIIQSFRVY